MNSTHNFFFSYNHFKWHEILSINTCLRLVSTLINWYCQQLYRTRSYFPHLVSKEVAKYLYLTLVASFVEFVADFILSTKLFLTPRIGIYIEKWLNKIHTSPILLFLSNKNNSCIRIEFLRGLWVRVNEISELLKEFWSEATKTSIFLLNKLLTKTLEKKTPYQA